MHREHVEVSIKRRGIIKLAKKTEQKARFQWHAKVPNLKQRNLNSTYSYRSIGNTSFASKRLKATKKDGKKYHGNERTKKKETFSLSFSPWRNKKSRMNQGVVFECFTFPKSEQCQMQSKRLVKNRKKKLSLWAVFSFYCQGFNKIT